jgi:5'-nucleotidase
VPVKTAAPEPVKADTTVTGTAGPVTYGTAGSVAVKVAPAAATGTVAVSRGNDVLGSVVLAAGQGTVTLPAKSLPVGSHTLTLTYSGDTGHKPSTGSVTVVVVKAEATVKARVKPKRVVADKTRARVVVRVVAEGYVPTGRVKVLVAGKTYRAKLVDGKAVIKLKEFTKPRIYKAKVSYLGDANTESARTTVKIRVKRR